MGQITEAFYRQLVLQEMERMVDEQQPVRLYFAPGNATYQQLRMIAAHKNMEIRAVTELAVKALFLALFNKEIEK